MAYKFEMAWNEVTLTTNFTKIRSAILKLKFANGQTDERTGMAIICRT
jgi:hypothetical protein